MNRLLKKIIFLCCLFVFAVLSAQTSGERNKLKPCNRMNEFMEQKKAFLMKEVGMTPEEAKRFFPIYNKMQKSKFQLHRDLRQKIKTVEQATTKISDDTYREVSQQINNLRLKEAQIENDYYREFTHIFSPQKLYKLQKAEMNFNREMLLHGGRKGPDRKGDHK